MIDEIDAKILNIIQQDARIANAEIARQVGLAPSAVLERVKKLEERGVIRGYAAEIDAAQVEYGLTAFVAVRTKDCCVENDLALAAIAEVLEVHDVAGEDSYLLKVRAKNAEELAKLLREKSEAYRTSPIPKRPSFCRRLRKQPLYHWKISAKNNERISEIKRMREKLCGKH